MTKKLNIYHPKNNTIYLKQNNRTGLDSLKKHISSYSCNEFHM